MANPMTRVLWWALVASLVIYVIVAHVVSLPLDSDLDLDILVALFGVLALATGIGSLMYRRRALSGPIQSGELDLADPAGQQRAYQAFMMNLVLSETVGIYGLTLAFLSGNPVFAILFCAGALFLMYLHRPTAPDLVPPSSGESRGTDSTPIG